MNIFTSKLHNCHVSALCLYLLLALTACGPSQSTVKPSDRQPPQEAEIEANRLIQSGDYAAAAEEYLKLSESDETFANLYRLKAAGSLFEAGEMNRSKEILQALDNDQLGQLKYLQKNILLAQIAVEENQAGTAIQLLETKPAESTPDSLLLAFHETRANAYSQMHEIPRAIDERTLAIARDSDKYGQSINHSALWQDLNKLEPDSLELIRQSAQTGIHSWLDLNIISREMLTDSIALQSAIQAWQAQYPGHPANTSIVAELLSDSENFSGKASVVAVLLPMTGKYRPASSAIQEGIMAAWVDDSGEKPELRFYDSDALNINQVYHTAIEEGADFVIGPLEKEAVTNLVDQSNTDTVRTLTLNYYDGELNNRLENGIHPGKSFFQFALAPEDEAMQVAERAYSEGLVRALVIAPANDWGNRVSDAFRLKFETLGGKVLERASLNAAGDDFSTSIISLLNTDESKQRAGELRQTLNRKIESETRRRQDVDFIFLASQPNHARQVVPHIYFQRASDVPIYATSHIYSSTPNPELDNDMKNIQFVDIPWIIDPSSPHSNIKHFMEQKWQHNSSTIKRLFALGMDAYELIATLPGLIATPENHFRGTTGNLSINEQGQIQRKLSWAKFENGIPELIQTPH